MTLHEILEKCKSDRVFITLVIIFVGIGSFGLGRLSKMEAGRQAVRIEAPTETASAVMAKKTAESDGQIRPNFLEQNLSGQVVASKTGARYHFPWCAGAKTISEANKIYFNSIADAQVAGYTPAGNCKGLR